MSFSPVLRIDLADRFDVISRAPVSREVRESGEVGPQIANCETRVPHRADRVSPQQEIVACGKRSFTAEAAVRSQLGEPVAVSNASMHHAVAHGPRSARR